MPSPANIMASKDRQDRLTATTWHPRGAQAPQPGDRENSTPAQLLRNAQLKMSKWKHPQGDHLCAEIRRIFADMRTWEMPTFPPA